MRIAGYVVLLFITGSRTGVTGRSVHHGDDYAESLSSVVDDVLQSMNSNNDFLYDDQEEFEDDLSVFDRKRRSYPLRCSFHSLCYCHSKITRRQFCCDCTVGPCFPGTSVVHTPNGTLPMRDLKIGHKVLTVNNEGELVYSRVNAFLDRRPSGQAEYLLLKTASGRTIQISSNHLIFTYKDNTTSNENISFAGDVNVGDYIAVLDDTSGGRERNIQRVSEAGRIVLDGAYVPLTEHGTLFVDGVLASCYASYDHSLAHLFLLPVRWFPQLFGQPTSQPTGVLPYVTFLKQLAGFILPLQYKTSYVRSTEVDIFRERSDFDSFITSCPK